MSQALSATQRATLINKLFKVAKKHYQPVQPPSNRTVLEHLLYACCLQESTFEGADESLARLQENYFDWNEVRVTTVSELAENMNSLLNPTTGATRLKKILHSVFETHYTFDIDSLKKENLGKAVQGLQKHKAMTPFVVSYVSQNALGGHSIPIDAAMVLLFSVLGLMSEKDAAAFKVTGLERTIPKTKGPEFFSVVHQLAVAFYKSQFNNDLRKIILSIDSSAKDRFPKRVSKKKPAVKKEPAKKAKKAAAATKEAKKPARKKAAAKPVKKKAAKATRKKAVAKKAAKKPTKKKAATKKTTKKKKAARKSPTSRLAKKKPR